MTASNALRCDVCLRVALATRARRLRRRAPQRTFATPEEAVRALTTAAAAANVDELLAIFGPGGQELIDSSDVATARKNREVFIVAVAEGWRLVDQGTKRKTLVIGNEDWPFSVPLVKSGEPLAIRRRRRKRRSDRAADRPQRAGGDRDLPRLREGPAPLRAAGSRRQPRGPLCDGLPQRSRQAERTVLAGEAR